MNTEQMARDEAIQRVLANAGDEWKEAARLHVSTHMKGEMVTGEDMRLSCLRAGIKPHHPNAWGGFVQGMVKQHILWPTNQFRQMRAPGSHARNTRVYEVL